MALIEDFEKKAITLLCSGILPNSVLHSVINFPESVEVKFTGAEYMLFIKHFELPTDQLKFEQPSVAGEYQGHQLTFNIFIDAQILCLECSNYLGLCISEEIRKGSIWVHAT